jgi:GH15 family glucan-1,4-alpha-glucosidase
LLSAAKLKHKTFKKMKTLLFVDHKNQICRIYSNCATKKQAKDLGLKITGDFHKFDSKEEAIQEANIWGEDGNGYNRNYVKL